MESINYSRTVITTGTQLIRYRLKKMGHLDLRHVTMLGLVKIPQRRKKQKSSKKKKKSNFVMDESTESDGDCDGDFENDEFGSDLDIGEFNDSNNEEEEEEEKEEERNLFCYKNDHTYSYVSKKKLKDSNKYKIEMLYTVSISGNNSPIKNCMPKAIAILSNSKKIFLSHIKTMLECLNPRFAELCYVDTDSCFFSMTFPSLEECLLKDKKDEFFFKNIMANEQDTLSCHGKMKCEGIFSGAKFRSLKVYRLYNEQNIDEKKNQTSHCKGVNTTTARFLPESMFDLQNKQQLFVTRNSIKPTRTGEILIVKDSKRLAIPFNLKRFVCADTIHTFPICYVPDE